jgi:hypothetical protein
MGVRQLHALVEAGVDIEILLLEMLGTKEYALAP